MASASDVLTGFCAARRLLVVQREAKRAPGGNRLEPVPHGRSRQRGRTRSADRRRSAAYRKAVTRHRLAMRQNLAPPIVATWFSVPLDSVPVSINV